MGMRRLTRIDLPRNSCIREHSTSAEHTDYLFRASVPFDCGYWFRGPSHAVTVGNCELAPEIAKNLSMLYDLES